MNAMKDKLSAESNPNVGTNAPPWPEFSDADINAQNWNPTPPPTADAQVTENNLFEDLQQPGNLLPKSLVVFAWKRPSEVFVKIAPKLFIANKSFLDMVSYNSHIMHIKVMRWMMVAVASLRYQGVSEGFPVEGESAQYCPNTRDTAWQPWHHIYSLCKAGKGVPHQPVLNPAGKYVVRLYYMGCWRKVIVDDRLPIDSNMNVLLPATPITNEIWPYILAKAILKVTCLSTAEEEGLANMRIVSLLTGWLCCDVSISENFLRQQKWELCTQQTDNYKWPPLVEEGNKTKSKTSKGKTSKDKASKGKATKDKTTKEKTSKDKASKEKSTKSADGSSKSSSKKKNKKKSSIEPQPRVMFIQMMDGLQVVSEKLSTDAPVDTTARWSHPFLVIQTRDVDLERPRPMPDLPPWKEYRWRAWAQSVGIIPKLKIEPIRTFKAVNYFSDWDHAVTELPSQVRQGGGDAMVGTPGRSVASESKPQKGKHGTKKKAEVKQMYPPVTDTIGWTEFQPLEPRIWHLSVFYRPSLFGQTILVSNIPSKSYSAGQKKASKRGTASRTAVQSLPSIELQRTRNDNFYIYLDSLAPKQLLVSFTMLPQAALQANVAVELLDWRSGEMGESLVVLRTASSRGVLLKLGEGRVVLRVWLCSPSTYVLQCLSDSLVVAGSWEAVRDAMQQESLRMANFCVSVATTFGAIGRKYGKDGYLEALSAFHQALNTATTSLRIRPQLHEAFLEEVVRTMKTTISSRDEFKTFTCLLRIAFLRLNLGLNLGGVSSTSLIKTPSFPASVENLSKTELVNNEEENHAALLIQAVLKRFVLQKFKAVEAPKNPRHKAVIEKLKKVTDALFEKNKVNTVTPKLVRNMLNRHPELSAECLFAGDLLHVVSVGKWNGSVGSVEPLSWTPVVRVLLHCHSDRSVPALVDLSVQLPCHAVHIVDNDTGLELTRCANKVFPGQFGANDGGYTLLVCGWSGPDNLRDVAWNLSIVGLKYDPPLHMCHAVTPGTNCTLDKPPVLHVHELVRFYVPNSDNLMFRCLVTVRDTLTLSFRLVTSYHQTKFSLELLTLDYKSLSKVIGSGVAMLPVIILSNTRFPQVETTYILEAFVLYDSWPLRIPEWIILEKLKRSDQLDMVPSMKSASSPGSPKATRSKFHDITKKIDKKSSGLSLLPEFQPKPSWKLQTVIDTLKTDDVTVMLDNRLSEKLKLDKEIREGNDPGRTELGIELRKSILERRDGRQEVSRLGSFYSTSDDDVEERTLLPPGGFSFKMNNKVDLGWLYKSALAERPVSPSESETTSTLSNSLDEEKSTSQGTLQTESVSTHPSVEAIGSSESVPKTEFEILSENINKERIELLTKQKAQHELINSFYKKSVEECTDMMMKAYIIRDAYISSEKEKDNTKTSKKRSPKKR